MFIIMLILFHIFQKKWIKKTWLFNKCTICTFFEHEKNTSEDNFAILRNIHKNPNYSQRVLAKELGLSLGKLNYCIKALKDKGLIKIRRFKKTTNKIGHIKYVLTSQGISLRTKLTINFMKKKMKEYDELKKELDK